MEDKYINRYHTFCNSLKKLEKSWRKAAGQIRKQTLLQKEP